MAPDEPTNLVTWYGQMDDGCDSIAGTWAGIARATNVHWQSQTPTQWAQNTMYFLGKQWFTNWDPEPIDPELYLDEGI
jgi:hypothetical protein